MRSYKNILKGIDITMELHISEAALEQFYEYLNAKDLNPDTIKKYIFDVGKLRAYLEKQNLPLSRDSIDAYLEGMKEEGYKLYTLNTIAASVNAYCRFIGRPDLKCSHFKIHRKNNLDMQSYLTSDEYEALIYTAKEQGDYLMAMFIQVIASMEIRMNELQYLTVESLDEGVVHVVRAKEKYDIYIPDELLGGLRLYVNQQKKESGIILSKKDGRILNRKSLWRNLKSLAEKAGVNPDKVSLRNLKKQLNRDYVEVEF